MLCNIKMKYMHFCNLDKCYNHWVWVIDLAYTHN